MGDQINSIGQMERSMTVEKARKTTVDCGIIEDLLPLYVDEVCTESSRQAIEAHLAECRDCRQRLATMEGDAKLPQVPIQQAQEEKALKKSFGRIRRRWMISLTAVLMIFPLVCLGVMSVNQYQKEGMCFTNLDEIATAKIFLKNLQQKQYEKAAAQIPFAEDYETILNHEYETFRDDFTEIHLSGETWMVSSAYPQEEIYKGNLDIAAVLEAEGETDFWRDMIYGYAYGVPIPEAVWNAVVGEYTVSENRNGIQVYFAGEGSTEVYDRQEEGFGRLETEWGVYYIDAVIYKGIRDADRETLLQAFYYDMKMMPAEIYQAVADYMPEYIAQVNASFDDWYGDVFSMTQEEYVAEMEKRFVQSMKSYEQQGYSFAEISFQDAYYNEEGWSIVLSVVEKNSAGKKEKAVLHLSVEEGQVRLGAWSSRTDFSLGEAIGVHYR